jgi:hypothetical protein
MPKQDLAHLLFQQAAPHGAYDAYVYDGRRPKSAHLPGGVVPVGHLTFYSSAAALQFVRACNQAQVAVRVSDMALLVQMADPAVAAGQLCLWCHGLGHTRRLCPRRPQQVVLQLVQPISAYLIRG